MNINVPLWNGGNKLFVFCICICIFNIPDLNGTGDHLWSVHMYPPREYYVNFNTLPSPKGERSGRDQVISVLH